MSMGSCGFSMFMGVNVEQDRGKVGEFRVDMRVISTRMVVVERANRWQSKRQDEDAEQGDHKAPRLDYLFS